MQLGIEGMFTKVNVCRVPLYQLESLDFQMLENRLAEIVKPKQIIPAVVKFYDIAGLVKGASEGEGLGNQFLSHIREVDAIVHLVRFFDDENVIRAGSVSPKDDIEIINTELITFS